MIEQNLNIKLGSILLVTFLVFSGLLIILQPISRTASAAETWEQTSDADFDDGTFENVFVNGTDDEAGLEIEASGTGKWTDKTPSPLPSSYPDDRFEHAMVTLHNSDDVLLFGGRDNGNWFNDTWIYNPNNDTWVNKDPANAPASGIRFLIASTCVDDKVVLFGGYNPGNDNETWVYDLSNNKWEDKTPVNPTPTNNPGERYGFALASIWGTDKIVLFSGAYGATKYDDLWIFDTNTDTWTSIPPPSTRPYARNSPIMVSIHGTDKLLMFGGNKTNETWIYDHGDNKWTEMAKLPVEIRSTRIATIYNTDNVLLVGGYIGTFPGVLSNRTWIFDYDDGPSGSWTEITGINSPTPRAGHFIAGVNNTKNVVLFGGYIGVNPWSSEETWIYDHGSMSGNGTYTSTPFDTGANSIFNKISWTAEVPAATHLKFRLRTANDEENLSAKDFIGPDGTFNTFYTSPGVNIWFGHGGDRWIQYKAYFIRVVTSVSPILKDINITYNCIPEARLETPVHGKTLSNNKPVFTWSFIDSSNDHQHDFQLLIDDDPGFSSIDFDSGKLPLNDQSWAFPALTSYTAIPDGTWYWKVRVEDHDGAWSNYTESWEFSIDTTLPSSTTLTPVTDKFYNVMNTITGTADDGASGVGVGKVEISIKQVQNNLYWDGFGWIQLETWLPAQGSTEWSFDSSKVLWRSGSSYQVCSRATDLANNIEEPGEGIEITIDKDSPTTLIDNPTNIEWLNNLDSISGSGEDISGAGIARVEISIMQANDFSTWNGNQWLNDDHWLSAEGTEQWSYDSSSVAWETGSKYVIRTRGIDNIDNIEIPGPGIIFSYDDVPPQYPIITINKNDIYTTSTTVTLSLEATDIGSGVAEMAFSTDGMNWTAWETFEHEKIITIPEGDGDRTIYYRVRDFANNIARDDDSIRLDSTPPEDVTVVINEDAEYTNSNMVTLDLSAVDEVSGIDMMSFSSDSTTWGRWERFENTKSILVTDGDGEKVIFYRVTDKAGNIALAVYDLIILDQTAPESLGISINRNSINTDGTSVLLELDATDALSGVEMMSFSTDNEEWTAWEVFDERKSYDLTAHTGVDTLYFRVRDRAGNVAGSVNARISANDITVEPTENDVPEKSSADQEFSYIPYMIGITVLVIMIILASIILTILITRKNRTKQEMLTSKSVTIKPNGFAKQPYQEPQTSLMPMTATSTSITPTLTPRVQQIQAPAATTTGFLQQPAVQAVPKVEPAPTQETMPAMLDRPKLPPAKIDEPEPAAAEQITTAIPSPTTPLVSTPPTTPSPPPVTTTFTQTPSRPQLHPFAAPATPEITATAPNGSNGPDVHLPAESTTPNIQSKEDNNVNTN